LYSGRQANEDKAKMTGPVQDTLWSFVVGLV
jgi:hypothetical protein